MWTCVGLLAVVACRSAPEVEIVCGPLDPAECETAASRVLTEAAERRPNAKVVRIEFSSADGAYFVLYEDGAGFGVQG